MVPTPRKPWMARGGDVDGDGETDLAVVVDDGVALLLGIGGGRFAAAAGSPFGVTHAAVVAVGDVDGDGAAEVAVGPWDGDEVVLLHGRTFARQSVVVGAEPLGVAIADLDGDGRGELIVTAAAQDELVIAELP